MRRVVQSRIGERGTCFRACVASILGLRESDVPDWPRANEDAAAVDRFLAPLGLRYEEAPARGPAPVGLHLGLGLSPRGGQHAVVMEDGRLKWDPHPVEDDPRRGLVRTERWGMLLPAEGRASMRDYAKWYTPAEIHHLADPGKNGVRAAARITRDLAEQSYFYWEKEIKAAEELGHFDDVEKACVQRDVYVKLLKGLRAKDLKQQKHVTDNAPLPAPVKPIVEKMEKMRQDLALLEAIPDLEQSPRAESWRAQLRRDLGQMARQLGTVNDRRAVDALPRSWLLFAALAALWWERERERRERSEELEKSAIAFRRGGGNDH
jgi:hypothetical protein